MRYYEYDEFLPDVIKLSGEIEKSFMPQAIVAIARGGLTIAHFISQALNLRNIFTLNSIHYESNKKLDDIQIFNIPELSQFKKVLLVDDMVDSGETMIEIKKVLTGLYPNIEFQVATLFYKEEALLMPEFTVKKTNEWIVFFWDLKLA